MNWYKLASLNQLATIGININDSKQPFTQQILSGQKTIETRTKPSLNRFIGQTVGIVRTGVGKAMLVGTMRIDGFKKYNSPEEFNEDYNKHLVSPTSDYYKEGNKYGYFISNVQKLVPVQAPMTEFNYTYRDISNIKQTKIS